MRPEFDGSTTGFQAGIDLTVAEAASGHLTRFGVLVGHSNTDGDVRGFALGQLRRPVGRLDLDATSFGAYVTRIGPSGWYIDAVAMGFRFDTEAVSNRGIGISSNGGAFAASLEAGYPISLGYGLFIEPQAQVIWQGTDFDNAADRFSTIDLDTSPSLTGRGGVRIGGTFIAGQAIWAPYVKADLWFNGGPRDNVVFNSFTAVGTKKDGAALAFGAGVTARLSDAVSFYGAVDYTASIDDNRGESIGGTAGFRITW